MFISLDDPKVFIIKSENYFNTPANFLFSSNILTGKFKEILFF